LATNYTLALELVGVTAGYDRSEILRDVSLSVRSSSVLGLLGRNGAGKTTCISAIAGMIRLSRGDIRLFGESVAALPVEEVIRRGIAVVPQGRRIFSLLTVKENLAVVQPASPPYAGQQWSLARVVDLFPRLGERLGQRAGTLSGGEQQMLAIGRALMASPRVLLMDEPSEGLSPQMIAEVARIIRQLRDNGLSILLVEQNSRLALSVADDIALLSSGEVVFAGTAVQLTDDPHLMETYLGLRAAASGT
jgi:branched-chain amino acid transport system ATP-binding protein